MSTKNQEWITAIKSHITSIKRSVKCETDNHPLKQIIVRERITKKNSVSSRSTPSSTPSSLIDIHTALEGYDPLTKFALEEIDPLSKIAMQNDLTTKSGNIYKGQNDINNVQTWDARKHHILNQFTTSEKISIISSYLNDDEQEFSVIVKAQSGSIDKVQHRLEQLDQFEEGSQKKFNLSQVEYVRRIDQLNKELVMAWNSEQRVKALKISIQCAKMLSDTDVLQFYPSKFVLITDILDIFGKLVFERLRNKSNYIKPGCKEPTALPVDFSSDMVPECAKETCRNWFYKIASIRELVPRIFVEMAILKSYSFLTSSEYSAALMRLTHMIRGIGNPLVSIYARCYLCRVGVTVTTPGKNNKFLLENFNDFLDLYKHLFTRQIHIELTKQKMEYSSYLTLYSPALDYMLQLIVADASDAILMQILARCEQQNNKFLLLNTIMAGFKPSYISMRALQFIEVITQKSNGEEFPGYVLLRTLGACVTTCPPSVIDRKQILNIAWYHISKIKNPEHYIKCADVWVLFAVQHFMNYEGEFNNILGDIIKHMSMEGVRENFYPELKSIIEKIVESTQDIEAFLIMDNFLPFIDLFQQEKYRSDVCKIILSEYNNDSITSDSIIINTIMFLCGVLHDSINSMSIDDDIRQISEIICGIIRKVDYGQNFEEQLAFYVEARGLFYNLSPVLVQLVHCVNHLSVKVRTIVKGRHTRKTGSFVKACAAYSFITIPSIPSTRTRLEMYLMSGRVALFSNCLGQADVSFKTAISIIPELLEIEEGVTPNEQFLISYLKQFLSTLLVVPDSPEKGVLHLTRVLLNAIKRYRWEHKNNLFEMYLSVLDMLSTMVQETYPYYVDKVESNDTFYGSEPKFIMEVNKVNSIILQELLGILEQLESGHMQATLSLKLVMSLVNRSDMFKNDALSILAVNLWKVSSRQNVININHLVSLKDYLLRKNIVKNDNAFIKYLSAFPGH